MKTNGTRYSPAFKFQVVLPAWRLPAVRQVRQGSPEG